MLLYKILFQLIFMVFQVAEMLVWFLLKVLKTLRTILRQVFEGCVFFCTCFFVIVLPHWQIHMFLTCFAE